MLLRAVTQKHTHKATVTGNGMVAQHGILIGNVKIRSENKNWSPKLKIFDLNFKFAFFE